MQLWAEIRRRVLAGELSMRQAAVDYELNFRTIQKIVHQAEPPTQQRLAQPERNPSSDLSYPSSSRSSATT